MSKKILEVKELNKSYDGINALAFFSSFVEQGEILGLIGPNGAGKTTLLNVISGFLSPESGNVMFREINLIGLAPHKIAMIGITRTFQNLRLIRQLSVLDNVLLSFKHQPGESLGNVLFRWRYSRGQELQNQKEALLLLDEVGLVEESNKLAHELSYGQQKLLSLVCCLAAKGELLLLDEPVAGIDPEMIDRILGMIQKLPSKGKSIILIEHNINAISKVCNRAVFMDAGAKVCEGTPEDVRNDSRVIEAYTN